jgi:hypothetical protein
MPIAYCPVYTFSRIRFKMLSNTGSPSSSPLAFYHIARNGTPDIFQPLRPCFPLRKGFRLPAAMAQIR